MTTLLGHAIVDDLDTLLAETVTRLLKGRGPRTLSLDSEGWAALDDVRAAAAAAMACTVQVEQIVAFGKNARRVEVRGTRIRVARAPWGPRPPDILFHATTQAQVDRVVAEGRLSYGRRRVFLSADEAAAWRAAHRLDGAPRVLVVDGLRARRSGASIGRHRTQGLFTADAIPARHILNLRPGYGPQWSAGGVPLRRFPDGELRMALIQVRRRSGVTWEVAKGKLEDGETPEMAAIREVQEEMGVDVDFRLIRHVGDVRYGFLAPGGAPRLKTIFLYLMEPMGPIEAFAPSEREGIGAVKWFTPDEAVQAVTHASLAPVMRRARDLVHRYGLTPSPDLAPDPTDP